MKAKAVFLDKDGTLIKNIPYNVDLRRIKFERRVIQGLNILQKAGFKLAVVSNQSGVRRGLFKRKDLRKSEEFIKDSLLKEGIALENFFYCFHYLGKCQCRKPKPGMLFSAAELLGIDLSKSWLIGDILNDIEAGNRAGCKSILIDNGSETEWKTDPIRTPLYVSSDLLEAALFILLMEKYRIWPQSFWS